ncbi:MAG: MarR family winged helix-turn-helix transcriptional regulator [Micrococcales bacterium]|nr:MarR family winged helix-turn-helix transcriptional regulator [Micrococcales bacterium]
MTQPQPRDELLRELQAQLRAVSLHSRRYVADVARALRLPSSDIHAVGVLKDAHERGREVTATELAHGVGLSNAAVTAMLDRMQRVGHATKHRSAVDARRVIVDPTDEGRLTSSEMFRPMNDSIRAALSGYSDAELEAFTQMLGRVSEAMQTAQEPTRRRPAGDSSGPDEVA